MPDWSKLHLVTGGWEVSETSDGITLSAQLYCTQGSGFFPGRGDGVPVTGECAVPSQFLSYIVTESKVTPCTPAGPWLCDVTVKAYLDDGDTTTRLGSSLLRERHVTVAARPVNMADEHLKGERAPKTCLCDFLSLDYYMNDGLVKGGKRQGVLRDLPAWCKAAFHSDKWRVYTKQVEFVYDKDGRKHLRHVTCELLGIPGWCGFKFDAEKYGGHIQFNDL